MSPMEDHGTLFDNLLVVKIKNAAWPNAAGCLDSLESDLIFRNPFILLGEERTVRIKCFALKHNTVSTAKVRKRSTITMSLPRLNK